MLRPFLFCLALRPEPQRFGSAFALPRHQAAFSQAHQHVDAKAHDADDDHAKQDDIRALELGRRGDHFTDPFLGGDKFSGHNRTPTYTHRNPRTGELIPIEARRVATFHASHKLKAVIQGDEKL